MPTTVNAYIAPAADRPLEPTTIERRDLGPNDVSIDIAFAGIWFFSITDRSAQANKERAAFKAQQVRAETGLGASKASGH